MIRPKILNFIKEHRLTPGNILLVCLAFWLTVLITRIVIFWSVIHGAIPAIFIGGYHIHHFITGFFLLLIALALLSKEVFSKYIPLGMLGGGLGLVFDEFLFWTGGHFDYWSMVNLTAVAVIGTAMMVTYVYAKRDDWALKNKFELHLKPQPRMLKALLPVIFMIIMLAAMFSYGGLDAAYTKQVGIQTVSEHGQVLGAYLQR